MSRCAVAGRTAPTSLADLEPDHLDAIAADRGDGVIVHHADLTDPGTLASHSLGSD